MSSSEARDAARPAGNMQPWPALPADDPDAQVLAFAERTRAVAADPGHWPRADLERHPPASGRAPST